MVANARYPRDTAPWKGDSPPRPDRLTAPVPAPRRSVFGIQTEIKGPPLPQMACIAKNTL